MIYYFSGLHQLFQIKTFLCVNELKRFTSFNALLTFIWISQLKSETSGAVNAVSFVQFINEAPQKKLDTFSQNNRILD